MATCGIRKLLDYTFTQQELYWLDDILPGSDLIKNQEQIEKNRKASAAALSSSNVNNLACKRDLRSMSSESLARSYTKETPMVVS